MFSQSALITAAVSGLLVGGLFGYLIAVGFTPKGGQSRRTLENRLKSTEQQLVDYQTHVTQHFERTADLVNNLTESYKDVHAHLASGAANLADPKVGQQFLANTDSTWAPSEKSDDLVDENASIEPPKDWAPRKGTLSEDFGLNKKTDSEQLPEQPKS